MLKLCYKNNDKRTDEYYFDLQSQKVYKICLSTYYAKQNTRGIPFVFISGAVSYTHLDVYKRQELWRSKYFHGCKPQTRRKDVHRLGWRSA